MLVRNTISRSLPWKTRPLTYAEAGPRLTRRFQQQDRHLRLLTARTRTPLCSATATEGGEVPPPLPRDDDVLPDNLADSLMQASVATAAALDRGATECIVEILIPEFWDPISGPVFSEEGDNLRFWKLCRRYLDNLQELYPNKSIKTLFPDMGLAAMIKNQWKDAPFEVGCLMSKAETVEGAEILVLAAPDPQSFESCQRVTAEAPEGCAVVMFNPRLASGDVGIGLNVRRMREGFLKSFVTVYSLRPIGDIGSVFRQYPGMWLVFLQDETTPGRYKLVAERPSRPAGDALDAILREAQSEAVGEDEEQSPSSSFVESVTLPIRSLQRFMKSLM